MNSRISIIVSIGAVCLLFGCQKLSKPSEFPFTAEMFSGLDNVNLVHTERARANPSRSDPNGYTMVTEFYVTDTAFEATARNLEAWLRENSVEPIKVRYSAPRYSEPVYSLSTRSLKPRLVVEGAYDSSVLLLVHEVSPENEQIAREAKDKVVISVLVTFP